MIKMSTFPVMTVDVFPGRDTEFVGCVTACCCLSKSVVQDISSNIRNWTVGGELPRYTEMISQAVDIVMDRIGEKAREMGADGVVGLKLSTTAVSAGAAEVIAYGTAVRFIDSDSKSPT